MCLKKENYWSDFSRLRGPRKHDDMSFRSACLASLDQYTYVEKMFISLRMEKRQHQWWLYMGKEAAVPLSVGPNHSFGLRNNKCPKIETSRNCKSFRVTPPPNISNLGLCNRHQIITVSLTQSIRIFSISRDREVAWSTCVETSGWNAEYHLLIHVYSEFVLVEN
jgi:hypothetical protein